MLATHVLASWTNAYNKANFIKRPSINDMLNVSEIYVQAFIN